MLKLFVWSKLTKTSAVLLQKPAVSTGGFLQVVSLIFTVNSYFSKSFMIQTRNQLDTC